MTKTQYSVNYSGSPSFQHQNHFKTDQNKKLLSVWIRCTARASKTVITTNYASLYGRAFYISSFSTGPDIYIRVSWHSCNCFGSCVLWFTGAEATVNPKFRAGRSGGPRLMRNTGHVICRGGPCCAGDIQTGVGSHIAMETERWHLRRFVSTELASCGR